MENLNITTAYEKFPLSLSVTHEPRAQGTDSQHLDYPDTGFPSNKQPCKNKYTQELKTNVFQMQFSIKENKTEKLPRSLFKEHK